MDIGILMTPDNKEVNNRVSLMSGNKNHREEMTGKEKLLSGTVYRSN